MKNKSRTFSTTPRPLAPQPRPVFRGVTVAPKPVHIQRNRGTHLELFIALKTLPLLTKSSA